MSFAGEIPSVRCYSCGKVLGAYHQYYDDLISGRALSKGKAFRMMGLDHLWGKYKDGLDGDLLTLFENMYLETNFTQSEADALTESVVTSKATTMMNKYLRLTSGNRLTSAQALDSLRLTRQCCRMRMMSRPVVPQGLIIPSISRATQRVPQLDIPIISPLTALAVPTGVGSPSVINIRMGQQPNESVELPDIDFIDKDEEEDIRSGLETPYLIKTLKIPPSTVTRKIKAS